MKRLKRLLCLFVIVLPLAAQNVSIPLQATIDRDYMPGIQEWMACTLTGPNQGKLDVCDKEDITRAQAIAVMQSWVDQVMMVFLEERAQVWLEKNRPDELPQDHQDALTDETVATALKNAKRARAVQ